MSKCFIMYEKYKKFPVTINSDLFINVNALAVVLSWLGAG